jgi:hypothetical protein
VSLLHYATRRPGKADPYVFGLFQAAGPDPFRAAPDERLVRLECGRCQVRWLLRDGLTCWLCGWFATRGF